MKNNFVTKTYKKLNEKRIYKKNVKSTYTVEYKKYLAKQNKKKYAIIALQFTLLVAVIALWEVLAQKGIINSFIMSSPSRIVKTIKNLYFAGDLFYHIRVTLSEAIIGFLIATIAGVLIAVMLWWSETLNRILEPYIVVLNSLPKIALGPIIIVWVGIGTSAIIVMDVLIMIIITIITMLNTFNNIDKNKILLLESMNAKKHQILFKLIIPASVVDFISLLKINVGLTWVGTIMGEYLVSRAGLGYLIVYGGQVFKLDLVMASTVILCVLAAVMYWVVALIEKRVSVSYKHK